MIDKTPQETKKMNYFDIISLVFGLISVLLLITNLTSNSINFGIIWIVLFSLIAIITGYIKRKEPSYAARIGRIFGIIVLILVIIFYILVLNGYRVHL